MERISEAQNDYQVIITGDLSVNGNNESFELVKEYLTDDIGLNSNKLNIIPGNHDRFTTSDLKTFNMHFNESEEYPIFNYFESEGYRFGIIGFDSTHPNVLMNVGRGFIEHDQFHKADEFIKNNVTDYLIVTLHHNPLSRDWKLALDNAKDFLKWVSKNDIDLALFGHVHDDFYDILPLKPLLKRLPKRRGISKGITKAFTERNLINECSGIRIKGRCIRYIDCVAYYFIRQYLDPNILPPENFETKRLFERYLQNLPEYQTFKKTLKDYKTKETALIMAGSACQQNERNTYIEISIDLKSKPKILFVKRHRYSINQGRFLTKTAKFKYS